MMNSIIIFGANYLYLVIVLATLGYVWLQSKGKRKEMMLLAVISFPLAYILAKIGSAFYESPRPFVVSGIPPLVPHTPDNGFPSDHTLFSVALAALVLRYDRRAGALLFILACLVGVARVYAGIHHGVDIIGSVCIASGAVYGVSRFVMPSMMRWYLGERGLVTPVEE